MLIFQTTNTGVAYHVSRAPASCDQDHTLHRRCSDCREMVMGVVSDCGTCASLRRAHPRFSISCPNLRRAGLRGVGMFKGRLAKMMHDDLSAVSFEFSGAPSYLSGQTTPYLISWAAALAVLWLSQFKVPSWSSSPHKPQADLRGSPRRYGNSSKLTRTIVAVKSNGARECRASRPRSLLLADRCALLRVLCPSLCLEARSTS